MDYELDAWQRTILFFDVLRERADVMLDHEHAGLPPVLDFEYEILLDAREFTRPANYALVRITTSGDACAEDCVDENNRPVIVIDPRAGHGPGIGGFRRDSEVGVALHEGHPVYFVIFFPEPCRDQTLVDVLHALRRFVEEVSARHAGKPPVLYGNCQAGWAIALLAADCSGLTGPTVLNGSPLSYWTGKAGVNTMRAMGGLTGGAWLVHFLSDLGDGTFDGAWLVQNFEYLSPATAWWDKYAHLFANIDSERERFLDFERWWNGYYGFSREEIVAIVENLFIGNRLEQGKVRVCQGCHVNLKRIRNPLIIFASYGDKITPPYQALGWIPAVYRSTDALKQAKQRIVFLTNPHVGHLGIFVSAKVVRFEHRAILESLDAIEALEPGLYEMKIVSSTGNADCRTSQFCVAFEEQRVENLTFDRPSRAFERVRQLSELNESLYRTFVSPLVRAEVNPWNAALARWLHPMRFSRHLISARFNPWMAAIPVLAAGVREHRRPVAPDNAFARIEEAVGRSVSASIDSHRKLWSGVCEAAFVWLFGREGDG